MLAKKDKLLTTKSTEAKAMKDGMEGYMSRAKKAEKIAASAKKAQQIVLAAQSKLQARIKELELKAPTKPVTKAPTTNSSWNGAAMQRFLEEKIWEAYTKHGLRHNCFRKHKTGIKKGELDHVRKMFATNALSGFESKVNLSKKMRNCLRNQIGFLLAYGKDYKYVAFKPPTELGEGDSSRTETTFGKRKRDSFRKRKDYILNAITAESAKYRGIRIDMCHIPSMRNHFKVGSLQFRAKSFCGKCRRNLWNQVSKLYSEDDMQQAYNRNMKKLKLLSIKYKHKYNYEEAIMNSLEPYRRLAKMCFEATGNLKRDFYNGLVPKERLMFDGEAKTMDTFDASETPSMTGKWSYSSMHCLSEKCERLKRLFVKNHQGKEHKWRLDVPRVHVVMFKAVRCARDEGVQANSQCADNYDAARVNPSKHICGASHPRCIGHVRGRLWGKCHSSSQSTCSVVKECNVKAITMVNRNDWKYKMSWIVGDKPPAEFKRVFGFRSAADIAILGGPACKAF